MRIYLHYVFATISEYYIIKNIFIINVAVVNKELVVIRLSNLMDGIGS